VQQGNENTSSILPAPVSNFSDRNGYDSVRANAMALEAYMSSNTDTTEKPNDHSAYAPKWARDSDHERSHKTPEREFPQRNGQSVPKEGPISDEARVHRPLEAVSLRPKQFATRARARPPLVQDEDSENYHMPRSVDPQFVRTPPPAPRTLGWLAALAGLLIATSTGAAIALFVTGKLPSELNKMLGLSTDTLPFVSKPRGDILNSPEQLSSTAARFPIDSTDSRSIAQSPGRVASVGEASERAATIRGVTDNQIRLGISAPFTGSAKELGSQMKLGIETAFNLINETGGIHGRQLKLVATDDGYEPTRTAESMKELYEKEQVFGFIGNVGTPTAVVALPYALERKTLFFGAFTGAGLLRRDPPDRYVFNYRASYAEETYAVVRYLVKVRGLRPDQIAVFAQQDAYGDAGFDGVAKAMRALRGGDERPTSILRLDYKRNTVDVDEAVARLRAHRIPIKAVVMVPAYRAAAKFIEKTRDLYPEMIYTNVSFVGSTALADELMLLGPRYAKGVIVTQVVPAVDSYASTVLKYKTALAKYFPAVPPDYVSLEGYVAGSVLLEGLKRADRQLDTEKLVEALETVRDFDMGLGAPISFGPTEHQGSHKVWGTQLNENGRYQPIDLE
jgi:ABC-type branched-subunit amino acid transport system substrate-binding protein